MRSKSEEYRRLANYCRRMAGNTRTELVRASWLRLAKLWLEMVVERRGNGTRSLSELIRIAIPVPVRAMNGSPRVRASNGLGKRRRAGPWC
jgi:hypothetical protein